MNRDTLNQLASLITEINDIESTSGINLNGEIVLTDPEGNAIGTLEFDGLNETRLIGLGLS